MEFSDIICLMIIFICFLHSSTSQANVYDNCSENMNQNFTTKKCVPFNGSPVACIRTRNCDSLLVFETFGIDVLHANQAQFTAIRKTNISQDVIGIGIYMKTFPDETFASNTENKSVAISMSFIKPSNAVNLDQVYISLHCHQVTNTPKAVQIRTSPNNAASYPFNNTISVNAITTQDANREVNCIFYLPVNGIVNYVQTGNADQGQRYLLNFVQPVEVIYKKSLQELVRLPVLTEAKELPTYTYNHIQEKCDTNSETPDDTFCLVSSGGPNARRYILKMTKDLQRNALRIYFHHFQDLRRPFNESIFVLFSDDSALGDDLGFCLSSGNTSNVLDFYLPSATGRMAELNEQSSRFQQQSMGVLDKLSGSDVIREGFRNDRIDRFVVTLANQVRIAGSSTVFELSKRPHFVKLYSSPGTQCQFTSRLPFTTSLAVLFPTFESPSHYTDCSDSTQYFGMRSNITSNCVMSNNCKLLLKIVDMGTTGRVLTTISLFGWVVKSSGISVLFSEDQRTSVLTLGCHFNNQATQPTFENTSNADFIENKAVSFVKNLLVCEWNILNTISNITQLNAQQYVTISYGAEGPRTHETFLTSANKLTLNVPRSSITTGTTVVGPNPVGSGSSAASSTVLIVIFIIVFLLMMAGFIAYVYSTKRNKSEHGNPFEDTNSSLARSQKSTSSEQTIQTLDNTSVAV